MRFLSRFSKTGLGIVPFRGTRRQHHTYTFKQPILAAAGFLAGARLAQRAAAPALPSCRAGCHPAHRLAIGAAEPRSAAAPSIGARHPRSLVDLFREALGS